MFVVSLFASGCDTMSIILPEYKLVNKNGCLSRLYRMMGSELILEINITFQIKPSPTVLCW